MSDTKAWRTVDSRLAIGGVAAALVVGIGIGLTVGAVSNDEDGSANASTVQSSKPVQYPTVPPVRTSNQPAISAAGIGQPVVDGPLQFVVDGVRRAQSIPDKYTPEAPQGEFFIVDMTITNVGNQQAEYRSQYQQLIVDGQMLAFADMATYKLTDQQIKVQLNPGIRIVTSVAFDIPAGTQPDSLEVHEDDFSTGAYVHLR